ncbi:bifunctional GMP synthase/glutamine amidotransferase protein [Bacillus sp. NRRL B-14911]|nr:bifunctional GMP synthase/glutamine amidotransferase protein [Bacillus sp. NRRL B-14911]
MAFMLKNRNSAFSVFAEESSGFFCLIWLVLDRHAARAGQN